MPSPVADSSWRTAIAAIRTGQHRDPETARTARGFRGKWRRWLRHGHAANVFPPTQLLASHPGLGDEAAIRLIYEEVCLRRESGDEIATTEVVNRFPRWKDELEVLLGCDRMLRPFSRVAMFPNVGEDLGPFRLLAEIGHGACGKTYLAAEPALGNRLVVLKVIADDQEEHLSLAQAAAHAHYPACFPSRAGPNDGLRAFACPIWVGRAWLASSRASLIFRPPSAVAAICWMFSTACGESRPIRRSPTALIAVIWSRHRTSRRSAGSPPAWRIALHGAHAHGLFHMDVKPSNVLIADDGLPVLLDFHLAHRPIVAGERIADRLGGTPGWMAPEHRAAMDAVGRGQVDLPSPSTAAPTFTPWACCFARPWLGPPGGAGQGGRSSRGTPAIPQVTVGLADIVEKCTANKPDDRYHDAAALADDLRRYLSEQPLRGVANRSMIESWRKWRRRRPAALTRWIAGLVSCTALIATLVLAQAVLPRAHPGD